MDPKHTSHDLALVHIPTWWRWSIIMAAMLSVVMMAIIVLAWPYRRHFTTQWAIEQLEKLDGNFGELMLDTPIRLPLAEQFPWLDRWQIESMRGVSLPNNPESFGDPAKNPNKRPLLDDSAIGLLTWIAGLEEVDLFMEGFADPTLDDLPEIPDLRRISFHEINLTDRYVSNLLKCKRLESLQIHLTNVDPRTIDHLSQMKHLKRLSLSAWREANQPPMGRIDLSGMNDLEWFHMFGCELDEIMLTRLSRLPRLKTLLLGPIKAAESGLAQLANLKSLELFELSLEPHDASVQVIEFDRLESLKDLRLKWVRLTARDIQRITRLGNLKDIELHHAKVAPEDLSLLAGSQSIVKLELWGDDWTNEHVAALTSCRSIHELAIHSKQVNGGAVESLMKMSHLTKLDVFKSPIGSEGIKRLSTLRNLKKLVEFWGKPPVVLKPAPE